MAASPSAATSEGSHVGRSLIRKLNALSIMIAASMILLVGWGLWQARQDAWATATRSSENLVATLSRNVATNMILAEQAVTATANALSIDGIWSYPAPIQRTILFNKGRASPFLDRLFILDAQGKLLAESTGTVPAGADFADRPYFQTLRAARSSKPYLSRLLTSRFREGEESLVLAKRVVDDDGRFAGIVAGVMPLHLMQPSIADVVIGPKSAINLFSLDGTILVRRPGLKPGANRNIGGTPTFERMKAEREGSFVGRSAVDGEQRLYSFARPGGVPLLLDVAISTDEILSPWWRRAIPPLLATLALCAAMLLLAMLFQRELLRRELVERQLFERATVDGLTGLLNRRSFDEALSREWRRARRVGAPLSLLMVDADHFKAFNDLYGHVAGDAVLKRIADAMRQTAKRASDQVARVGGEEFVILLPDTDRDGAMRCAAALLERVEAAGVEHRGNPTGKVSVSIGVAAVDPEDEGEGDLVRAADAALYRAKDGGRNRACAAT
ncbi:diguanylate cyclase [Sphingomonas sp. ac-8]|uniref:sensor domain-containing diguanylate cyclase n=1 Tax=Sphingomonas sp. ac-8 TaxID=3242977 RepID=UPI003A7FA6DF